MGRFWNNDDFIRKDARKLKPLASLMYLAYSCYVNKLGITWASKQLIADCLGINKSTAGKYYKELLLKRFIEETGIMHGRVAEIKLLKVPLYKGNIYDRMVAKEDNKEDYKESSVSTIESAIDEPINIDERNRFIAEKKAEMIKKSII